MSDQRWAHMETAMRAEREQMAIWRSEDTTNSLLREQAIRKRIAALENVSIGLSVLVIAAVMAILALWVTR